VQARKYDQAHADAVNELNTELAAEGKFAINNNVGNGIDTVTVAMLERFGALLCWHLAQELSTLGI
jgi:hypothetical protein